MKSHLNLSDAKKSDVETTYRIKCNSLKPYIEKLWTWDDAYQHALHKKKFKASNTKLIIYNKQVIGYLILTENEHEIFIENLLIDNTFQNLGIGKDVMTSSIQKANLRKKPIRLQVFKINAKAQKFYKTLGFDITSQKEHHVEMTKHFEG